jgi:hypothetical protein
MNCVDCQDLLQRHLDGLDLGDQGDLELHLVSCPACRIWHDAAGRLQQGLGQLTPELPPVGLAARIGARLLDEHAARRRWRRRVVLVSAAAALLAVVLSARLFWFPLAPIDLPLNPSGPVVRQDGTNKPSNPPIVDRVTVRDSVSEVGSVMASAAARTADATVEQSRIFLPLVASAQIPSLQLPPTVEAPTLPLREAGQGMSDGLAPVADSARRAFDLFLRDLPPMNLDEKSGL